MGDIGFMEKVFTKEEMIIFADISGDKDPIHLDEKHAKTCACNCVSLTVAVLLVSIPSLWRQVLADDDYWFIL